MRRNCHLSARVELYMVSLTNYLFARQPFSPKFLSFIDDYRATPVQDMAQRRHRRRRAVGTRSKDSFQIKTMRKPFLLSLVDTYPPLRRMLTSWHVATPEQCTYLDTRGFLQRPLFRPGLYHKDRIPQGVFGVASLALYASALNHDSQFSAFSTEVLTWPNRGTIAVVFLVPRQPI